MAERYMESERELRGREAQKYETEHTVVDVIIDLIQSDLTEDSHMYKLNMSISWKTKEL